MPEGGQIRDILSEHEQALPESYGFLHSKTSNPASIMPLAEADRLFNKQLFEIVIKLLLALTARPDLVEMGSERKPASVKKGKAQRAFWSPNICGLRSIRGHGRAMEVAPEHLQRSFTGAARGGRRLMSHRYDRHIHAFQQQH